MINDNSNMKTDQYLWSLNNELHHPKEENVKSKIGLHL